VGNLVLPAGPGRGSLIDTSVSDRAWCTSGEDHEGCNAEVNQVWDAERDGEGSG
jgi:hypothetical protein